MRIRLIELPNLAVGTPAEGAVPGVAQRHVRDFLKTTCRVKAPGEFVGERLVVDKVICAGRADGLLVEAHRVEGAAFNSRDLGGDKRSSVGEVLGAVLRPRVELLVVGGQRLQMAIALVRRSPGVVV